MLLELVYIIFHRQRNYIKRLTNYTWRKSTVHSFDRVPKRLSSPNGFCSTFRNLVDDRCKGQLRVNLSILERNRSWQELTEKRLTVHAGWYKSIVKRVESFQVVFSTRCIYCHRLLSFPSIYVFHQYSVLWSWKWWAIDKTTTSFDFVIT